MKSRYPAVLVIAALLFGVGIGAVLYRTLQKDPPNAAEERLRRYCLQVHVSLEVAAQDLASGKPSRQQEAADRFGELTTFHSFQEISLCSQTPPNMKRRDTCWLKKDYACLAEMANAAAAATKP